MVSGTLSYNEEFAAPAGGHLDHRLGVRGHRDDAARARRPPVVMTYAVCVGVALPVGRKWILAVALQLLGCGGNPALLNHVARTSERAYDAHASLS
jgi:hypothetical protein